MGEFFTSFEDAWNHFLPLRDAELGAQVVQEVRRVRFPAARSTLLRPSLRR